MILKYYEETASVGKHSLHEVSTDNGRRLDDWATSRGLVISSTYFAHPKIYNAIWITPDQRTKNQIDHKLLMPVMILVMDKIRSRMSTPKLKRGRVSSANTMRDVLKQKDLSKKFSEEISRKLRSISTDSTTGSEHWELCSNVVLDTAKEVLNVNPPRRRSPWFDEECAEAICAKNEASRKKLQRETRAADDHY